MRRIIITIALLWCAALHAEPASLEGTWSGRLEAGKSKLRIVFQIERKDGAYTARMSSPDQGANDLPVDGVKIDGDSITIEMHAIRAQYAGRLAPDGNAIDGEWRQPGTTLPLRLQRGILEASRRPQEPAPPLPYDVRETCWRAAAAGVELCGTLTIPRGSTSAAVVLLAGSGLLDRDAFAFGHRPLLVLADRLARHGIAALRFDHRGVGKSTGDYASTTTSDRVDDAASALATLRAATRDVPAGLIGHSEGGVVAAMLAARDAKVAFVVLLNAPGLRGRDLLALRAERIARRAGVSEDDIARDRTLRLRALDAVVKGGTEQEVAGAVRAIIGEETRSMSDAGRKQLGYSAAGIEEMVVFHSANRTWLKEYLGLDPALAISNVRAPVLIVAGERDMQVPAEANAFALEAAKRAGGHANAEVRLLPRLNHLLQTAETGMPNEYSLIDETIAEPALDAIIAWIGRATS